LKGENKKFNLKILIFSSSIIWLWATRRWGVRISGRWNHSSYFWCRGSMVGRWKEW